MKRRLDRTASTAEPTEEIALPCDFLSPRVARRFVTETLHGKCAQDLIDSAELLVSEVVTRIVVHGCTGLLVALQPGRRLMLTITYASDAPAGADRLPGPVAPKLARHSTRIDLDDRTVQYVFVLNEESAATG